VVLVRDVPEAGLRAGDLGAVVGVRGPDALEVEFVSAAGRTGALRTLGSGDVRPVREDDLLAVRAGAPAAGAGRGAAGGTSAAPAAAPPTLAGLRGHRAEILRLTERHRVRNVRVFGSVARGEPPEPWSDVDVVVDPLPGHSLLDRAGLIVALAELLGAPVDVVTERELRGDVRDRVAAEAAAL
jgi:predicted nucleotidyltransferase